MITDELARDEVQRKVRTVRRRTEGLFQKHRPRPDFATGAPTYSARKSQPFVTFVEFRVLRGTISTARSPQEAHKERDRNFREGPFGAPQDEAKGLLKQARVALSTMLGAGAIQPGQLRQPPHICRLPAGQSNDKVVHPRAGRLPQNVRASPTPVPPPSAWGFSLMTCHSRLEDPVDLGHGLRVSRGISGVPQAAIPRRDRPGRAKGDR